METVLVLYFFVMRGLIAHMKADCNNFKKFLERRNSTGL